MKDIRKIISEELAAIFSEEEKGGHYRMSREERLERDVERYMTDAINRLDIIGKIYSITANANLSCEEKIKAIIPLVWKNKI